MIQTRVYKRSHENAPAHDTGIFGNNDCRRTHRDRIYDAVIGIFWKTFERKDGKINRSAEFKISLIVTGINRLELGHDTIELLNHNVASSWNKNCKGSKILAFDHFMYF